MKPGKSHFKLYIRELERANVIVVCNLGVGPQHLYGRTEFGDNVEDEWFIVFLLQQLTITFDGLVAK